MQGLMSMMSLDFVTNATAVKSCLSREAGNATNVKFPLRREEGMMTQVKSFRHGHPEGTHATDDKSSLNGRQGSNDATDSIKSHLQGRLGSRLAGCAPAVGGPGGGSQDRSLPAGAGGPQ